jgi:hypothetical protein
VRVRILSVLNDIQVMLGLVGFSYGFWLAWRPLGFIVGGVALFALGILFGRSITDVRRRS